MVNSCTKTTSSCCIFTQCKKWVWPCYHTLIVLLLLITLGHFLPHNRQRLGEKLCNICERGGTVKEVSDLLMKGADVNWRNSLGWTALHYASFGKPDIIKELLKSSPNINQQDVSGGTPLHKSCTYGYLLCVKLLLATGQCDTGQCESASVYI